MIDGGPAPALAVSAWKLALALFELAEDVAVIAVHIVRHAPYVDCPEAAECANVNGRGIRPADVAPPLAAVTEDGDSADVDVNALRHIYIDVTEGHEDGHGRLRMVDRGFAQIEVEVSQDSGGDGPPAQSQPAAPHDVTEQGCAEAGGFAARTGYLRGNLRQVYLDTRQLPSETSPKGDLDPLGELIERQAPRKKMIAKRDNSLLALGIRDAKRRIVHGCHVRPR